MGSRHILRHEPFEAFIPEFERLIADVMQQWNIPGLAVSVVQDGQAPYIKTFGLRDVEADLPVTPDTQFQIMSVSKSFAATGLAVLVDEKRVAWSKPVRDYLPEFRLYDEVASDRVTVRDLLCHHSGLPRHDWIWLPGDLSPAQVLLAMRHLEPSADIRTTFQYSNLGYLVATLVTERVSDQPWPAFIRERLTDKLKMTVTFTSDELSKAADAAVPYALTRTGCQRSALWPVSVMAAGGMSASIAGMTNWLRFHLGEGEFEGQRLLSPALIHDMQKPLVHVGRTEFSEYSDVHYGLGLRSHWYNGRHVVWHGGGWTGTNALLIMMPDYGIGVAILANIGMVPLLTPHILANSVFDWLTGVKPVSWFDRLGEQRAKIFSRFDTDRKAANATSTPRTEPSHALADYVGTYEHPGYGQMDISLFEGQLHWAFRGMSEVLAHRHDDVFELPETPKSPGSLLPGRLAVSFSTDHEGRIASAAIPFEPMVKDIVFQRMPTAN
ncbi:MAG TPA: serine hydrolase [Beijerinckiaceae bacterium]|jgi:CubicO group peptidase (beta-lactamase class C family)|nr:serine hydrolase [Beijerinckiaceae bacterium]